KPKQPRSPFAVPGLYVYDNQVVDLCRTLRPSARNELEITDLNLLYLNQNQLHVKLLSRGMAWLDTGTTTTLLEASNYIATIEHRQGLKIACLEEVALRMGFITQSDLEKIIEGLRKNEYREYLRTVWDEGPRGGARAGGLTCSRGRRPPVAAINDRAYSYFGCSRSKWFVSASSLVTASGSVAS